MKTADRRGAGTSARVFMNIIGTDGETGDRPLDSKRSNFSRSSEDEFVIEAVDIGTVLKIRIGHDNAGLTPGWMLDTVNVWNMDQPDNGPWDFLCGRWLARDEDDKQIVRELLPKEDADTGANPGAVTYTVEVHTGDVRGAGTDANVYIQIFGTSGDSGSRQLQNKWKNDFERGHIDLFSLEAADLGELERVRIGHDGSGYGAGWYLDKIVIKGANIQEAVFPCNRWLDKKEDDGLTERELYLEGSEMATRGVRRRGPNLVSYLCQIQTMDVMDAGTDANIQLQLFGTQGSSTLVEIENGRGKFERNKRDEVRVEAAELGELEKISIGHDSAGPQQGWALDSVTVIHEGPGSLKGSTFNFLCQRWLDEDEDDGLTTRILPVQDPPES